MTISVLESLSAKLSAQLHDRLHPELVLRSFKGLYDYEPAVMSPNKDAVNEELSFQVGDIIDVYGDVDVDGFYLGEVTGCVNNVCQ